jgi:hypothetical protein
VLMRHNDGYEAQIEQHSAIDSKSISGLYSNLMQVLKSMGEYAIIFDSQKMLNVFSLQLEIAKAECFVRFNREEDFLHSLKAIMAYAINNKSEI